MTGKIRALLAVIVAKNIYKSACKAAKSFTR